MTEPMTDPNWIEVLREACRSSSQSAVASRIGYSASALSAVLSGTYAGNLERVQRAVEGALMNHSVDCPVVGDMPRQRCVEHQRAPKAATNPMRVALYHACRSGCPHSFIQPAGRAGKETL